MGCFLSRHECQTLAREGPCRTLCFQFSKRSLAPRKRQQALMICTPDSSIFCSSTGNHSSCSSISSNCDLNFIDPADIPTDQCRRPRRHRRHTNWRFAARKRAGVRVPHASQGRPTGLASRGRGAAAGAAVPFEAAAASLVVSFAFSCSARGAAGAVVPPAREVAAASLAVSGTSSSSRSAARGAAGAVAPPAREAATASRAASGVTPSSPFAGGAR